MIVAAAIRFGDLVCFVPKPGRHHDVIRQCAKNGMPTPIGHGPGVAQGFVDDAGQFLTRREAYDHAMKCDQPFRSLTQNERLGLFSEDLW